MDPDKHHVTAAACRYLLAGLLPRLERIQPGLIAELRSGIAADRAAMSRSGTLSVELEATVKEALRILDFSGEGDRDSP
jgi:hypothetical protein